MTLGETGLDISVLGLASVLTENHSTSPIHVPHDPRPLYIVYVCYSTIYYLAMSLGVHRGPGLSYDGLFSSFSCLQETRTQRSKEFEA